MNYYLVTNKIISKTCSDEPDWLKEHEYWNISTSKNLKKTIIVSEKAIPIRTGIKKLTEAEAQAQENDWHSAYEYTDEITKEKRTINPVQVNKFGNKWNKLKGRIEKIKEKKNES